LEEKADIYARHFLLAGQDVPWRWAKDFSCIEWSDGSTLCFREEIEAILLELSSPDWLPEFQDVLCIMATLKMQSPRHWEDLRHYIHLKLYRHDISSISPYRRNILRFLKLISALPAELKQDPYRQAFFRLMFPKPENQNGEASGSAAAIALQEGILDDAIRQLMGKEAFTGPSEFHMYSVLADHYEDTEQLAEAIRSQLAGLPKPADLDLPPPAGSGLLTQLSRDEETAGLAAVARQLTAIMNLPRNPKAQSDLPLGGIADITNRGDFSKLLLSELANDEWTLTARLVNNEALYYQQEAPLLPPPARRIVLLDTTIRLWGSPRLVGISAALALGQSAPDTRYFLLSGNTYQSIHLSSKEEVLQVVDTLHAEIDCSGGLEQWLKEHEAKEDTELVFISEAGWIHRPELQQLLSTLRKRLQYWVAVERSGKVEVHRFTKGKRRRLINGRVDVNALLPPKIGVSRADLHEYTPAYLKKAEAPLYWPCDSNKPEPGKAFTFSDEVFLTIDRYQRLLLWPQPKRGAVELAQDVPRGAYYLVKYNPHTLALVAHDKSSKEVSIYRYSFKEREIGLIKPPTDKPVEEVLQHSQNDLLLLYDGSWHGLNGVPATISPDSSPEAEQLWSKQYLARLYKRVNKRCCTLRNIERAAVDRSAGLIINNKQLIVEQGGQHLTLRRPYPASPSHPAQLTNEQAAYARNSSFPVSIFVWPDGSLLCADWRGKLFLRSSREKLPEVTIVCDSGSPTAAWASDGRSCGPHFYTGRIALGANMPARDFYERYIQPFIEQIISYAA
jgi:hypothetical protein